MKILLFILLYFDHLDMETTCSKRTKFVLAGIINEILLFILLYFDHFGMTSFPCKSLLVDICVPGYFL